MKKKICLFILFLYPVVIFCGDLNISYTVKEPECKKCSTGEIKIAINNGEGAFYYYLYSGDPFKNGKEINRIESTTSDTAVFSNLKPGKYFIAVKDNTRNLKGCQVVLDIKKTKD